jgi:hypothetical protein
MTARGTQKELISDFAEALDDAFDNRAMKALQLLDRLARNTNIMPAVEAELKRRKEGETDEN